MMLLIFTTPQARAESAVIVAFGDSITAGLGVNEQEAWPYVAQKMLADKGRNVTIVNAGVSGDTTAGGKARLAWSLDGADPKPGFAVVALGGNDALRALTPENSFQNLDAIIIALKKRNMPVLLAGMLAPPNLGEDFGQKFQAIYTRLATKHKIPLYPFLLEGVAGIADLNQHDGIHPTPEGQRIIARKILPYIEALLAGK
jgi:acyl-CoA thioesterase I